MRKKILIYLVLLLSALLLFSLLIHARQKLFPQHKLTNPLLAYMKFRELRPFRAQIEELLKQEIASGRCQEAGVYFRSLPNGIWIGINEKQKFAPASLLKVPVMMAYFKEAQDNPGILSAKVNFSFSPGAPYQYIKPEGIDPGKKEYTIEELIEIMVEKSDNEALSFLSNYPPMLPAIQKAFNQFGLPRIIYAPGDSISIRTYSSFFRILYNASYLNQAMSEKALRLLSRSQYKGGLVAGVPAQIKVAHKFGERTFVDGKKELHDVGIIYYPENPYLLGIMTKGSNFEDLSQVIKDFSALVYQEVDRQYRQAQEDVELFQ